MGNFPLKLMENSPVKNFTFLPNLTARYIFLLYVLRYAAASSIDTASYTRDPSLKILIIFMWALAILSFVSLVCMSSGLIKVNSDTNIVNVFLRSKYQLQELTKGGTLLMNVFNYRTNSHIT